ncbi:MAG: ubiquinol-cytochrome c reductase iron-sulfur subunit [Thermoplasmatota archaeon]
MTKSSDGVPPADYVPDEPYEKPESILSRRSFIRRNVQLAVAGALIPGTLAQLLPAVAPDAIGGGGSGPVVRRDPDTNAKIPITVADLAGETPVVVTAEWNFLPAVVYKVKKAQLEASTEKRGYNTAQHAIQHPTEPDNALLIYDGKCKHLGCTVGWNGSLGGSLDQPDYDEDGALDGRILCPCHQGQYDIYDLAKNVPGTPPPAPLNVITGAIGAATGDDGTSYPDAIVGVEKLIQDAYRGADTAGSGSEFALSEVPL